MANLTEVSQWENVIRQLENGEAATGGADGLANMQAKQLANRTKWLKDNYFPLSGALISASVIAKDNLAGYLQINGGNTDNDAFLNLFASESSRPGNFSLRTGKNESGGRGILEASPTTSLLWNGADLGNSAIVAKSLDDIGYIKYASGLTIQWGYVDITNASRTTVTFPINFAVNVCTFLATINWRDSSNDTLSIRHVVSNVKQSAEVVLNEIVSGTTRTNWIAIGR